jgi:hypothetical protein
LSWERGIFRLKSWEFSKNILSSFPEIGDSQESPEGMGGGAAGRANAPIHHLKTADFGLEIPKIGVLHTPYGLLPT